MASRNASPLSFRNGSQLYTEPGNPWENDYCEFFNGKSRDECLDPEVFYGPKEAHAAIEQWGDHVNTIRPHPSPGYQPPRSRQARVNPHLGCDSVS